MKGMELYRSWRLGSWFAALVLAAVAATGGGAEAETDRPIALVGGMLLDGYEAAPVHNAVVVIAGNKIIASGPVHDTAVPADAYVIDTRGKTVLPGLIDMHAHMELIGHGDYKEYYDYLGGIENLEQS
ncbi:MAG: hypothetical protein MI755_00535, partial [Sphingomonadales bacterium]|nr:hypothetical protein [Sphingomonadales bacterium]